MGLNILKHMPTIRHGNPFAKVPLFVYGKTLAIFFCFRCVSTAFTYAIRVDGYFSFICSPEWIFFFIKIWWKSTLDRPTISRQLCCIIRAGPNGWWSSVKVCSVGCSAFRNLLNCFPSLSYAFLPSAPLLFPCPLPWLQVFGCNGFT